MEHIQPGYTIVTLLTYDMEIGDDNNICTEIKDFLMNHKGWRNNIPRLTLKKYGQKESFEYGEDMPASSLWKVSVDPDEAINDFILACRQYDVAHAGDTPMKRAKGKAFAICNTMYNAVEIK